MLQLQIEHVIWWWIPSFPNYFRLNSIDSDWIFAKSRHGQYLHPLTQVIWPPMMVFDNIDVKMIRIYCISLLVVAMCVLYRTKCLEKYFYRNLNESAMNKIIRFILFYCSKNRKNIFRCIAVYSSLIAPVIREILGWVSLGRGEGGGGIQW